MKLDLSQTPTSSRQVLVLEDLAVGYGNQSLLTGSEPNRPLPPAIGIDWTKRSGKNHAAAHHYRAASTIGRQDPNGQ